ncbi:MAG: PIN domain-containing protein [Acidobacteria bacterium]|nr:PIN domain-containing protein [Acidobacteriota bacterium]
MSEFAHLNAYLDANVLFSASHSPASRLLQLWQLMNLSLTTSAYAIDEVRKNILNGHHQRFTALLTKTQLVSDANLQFIPADVVLAEKDRPILAAAIAASVDFLVTGDKNHFGHLYNSRIAGVAIVAPADFLNQNAHRLIL